MTQNKEMLKCPCGSNLNYSECCGRAHRDQSMAKTALQLMKSRYSAYVLGKIDYIKQTTHPKKRKSYDFDQLKRWSKESEWCGLEILDAGSKDEKVTKDIVKFKAKFIQSQKMHEHVELSRFEKKKGLWYYLDGDVS
ncbi:YchJ family protein [Aureibacter tunicatorum]|uniref:SEC-C motif-containing protein n=1 Tax=Aureibacter tunicatorum TaxID=866807 RepID=A0AAE3XIZ3_9BACT|nr:YchJ family protein [Aureibacter tunicatorum]MDR6237262.1 SEC-C motif-containing protein [Aureibacter tunicatorum]BDD06254.1 preprotein translocase SecA [Aureibacter tunicatorum]